MTCFLKNQAILKDHQELDTILIHQVDPVFDTFCLGLHDGIDLNDLLT